MSSVIVIKVFQDLMKHPINVTQILKGSNQRLQLLSKPAETNQ